MRWWWLSFADERGFLGVAVVQAIGFIEAVLVTKAIGINPGGEVKGLALEELSATQVAVLVANRDRLLSRADIEAMDLAAGGDGTAVRL